MRLFSVAEFVLWLKPFLVTIVYWTLLLDSEALKLSHRHRIGRLFWSILSTIGFLHYHPNPNGMSSQNHVPHCRVKEFHPPYTEVSFFAVFQFFCFLNVVWALASSGFRIVSDTLVTIYCQSPCVWCIYTGLHDCNLMQTVREFKSVLQIADMQISRQGYIESTNNIKPLRVIAWGRHSSGLTRYNILLPHNSMHSAIFYAVVRYPSVRQVCVFCQNK